MKLKVLLLSLAASGALFAQNLVGTWQGTLTPPNGRALRLVLKVTRADDESLKGVFYSIDQGGQPLNASSISQQGLAVKVGLVAIGGSWEGKLAPDGNTMTGTWSQGGQPAPLNFEKSPPATAWEIPEPPPPPKVMPTDAKPVFEVATIKPANPDTPGRSMLVGRGGSNLFTTTNSSVADLITMAYGVHMKQVTGGPSWIDSERFDISAKPDLPGMPNLNQLKSMIQKLLAERFGLQFHREKKELSCYAITVAKSGPKITKSQSQGILPGYGGRGPGGLGVTNSTMEEFAQFLQARLLDRPVVDQTGLSGRWDFQLQWQPDQAPGAGGDGAAPAAPPANADRPNLFGAFQEQLGLKLEATKAPVEVMVIDKLTKPTEN